MFINGEPVHAAGDEIFDPASQYERNALARALLIQQLRPEASEGENVVSYVQIELKDSDTTVDVKVYGAGPTRADPSDFGLLHAYPGMPRWHSIFTLDKAAAIVPYSGSCPD